MKIYWNSCFQLSPNRFNRSYWKFQSVVSDKNQFAFSWNVSADWTGIVCKTYCEILLSTLIYLLIQSTVRNSIFLDPVYWMEILMHSLKTNVNATFHLQFFFLCLYLLNSVFLNIVAIKRNSLFEELLKISRFDELCILKQKVNSTSYGPLVRDSISLSRLCQTQRINCTSYSFPWSYLLIYLVKFSQI